jgi:hypothetical protein
MKIQNNNCRPTNQINGWVYGYMDRETVKRSGRLDGKKGDMLINSRQDKLTKRKGGQMYWGNDVF